MVADDCVMNPRVPYGMTAGQWAEAEKLYDKPHLRHRFGYQHNVEMCWIRQKMADEGHDPDAFGFEFKVIKRHDELKVGKPSFRQRQAVWRASIPEQNRSKLNLREIEYLIERLEGVNDPTGASALQILTEMHPTFRHVLNDTEGTK